MDLFREVVGKLDTEENKLSASREPNQISLATDYLRVKKYSTVIKQQSNVTSQNMRLEYLFNKQLYNGNEPLSVNTMHKLKSLPGLLYNL